MVINNEFYRKYLEVLFLTIIVSIFFLPDIIISTNWPSFHLTDFLIPFIFFPVLINCELIKWKKYGGLILIFISIIFISILFNNRLGCYRDYFEMFKVIKLFLIAMFASVAIKYVNIKKVLNAAFILLVIFNFIQYFELFHIDILLKEVYGFEKEVTFFGKNTLGEPASKRMIGLIGNPNNNSILFLFFTFWYFKASIKFSENWRYYLSVLMVCMCQSKTAILALFTVVLIGSFLMIPRENEQRYKLILMKVGATIGVFCFSFLIDLNYFIDSLIELIEYIFFNKHREDARAMSTRGRWEVWTMLFEMILKKPLIGYGPYKEFFYERELYSENEYILMWWRHGIFGLLSYISLLIYPVKLALINKKNEYAYPLILFTLVILISALTNNPILNRNIQALYAVLLGIFFSKQVLSARNPHTLKG